MAQYFGVARRWWWVLAIGAALAIMAGAYMFTRTTPLYQASTRLFVNQVQTPGVAGYSDIQASERLALTYTQLLHSPSILEEAIKTLDLPISADALKANTKTQPVGGTQLLELSVTDPNPQQAAKIANGLSTIFVRHIQELQSGNPQLARQQVDQSITDIQQRIGDTQRQLDQSNTNAAAITTLQQQLTQYDQDTRDIKVKIADTSDRLNSVRSNPDANELQQSQSQIAQYDQSMRDIRTQIADATNRLSDLRTSGRSADDQNQVQAQIDQYNKDLADIQQKRNDAAGRLDQLQKNPTAIAALPASAEAQRLANLLAQYNKDLADTQQKSTDANAKLAQLRATPPTMAADTQRLRDQLTQLQEQNRKLLDTRQSLALAQSQGTTAIAIADAARVPTAASKLRPIRNGGLAGVFLMLLTVGVVLVLDVFDDRIHDPKDVRQQFGIPVFATFGLMRADEPLLVTNMDIPNIGRFREGMRAVRTHLEALVPEGCAAICITSADDAEGKSTIAANLALLEAQAGKRVILIDANVRAPGIHEFLGLRNNQGLSAYLDRSQPNMPPKLQDGPLGIKVLTAGWALNHLPDLLGSRRMTDLIWDFRSEADIIIIDSAAVLPTSDTLALQRAVDGTIVVVDVRATGTKTLERALDAIEGAPGTIYGLVLTKDRKNAGTYGVRHRDDDDEMDDEAELDTPSLPMQAGADAEMIEAKTGTYGARR